MLDRAPWWRGTRGEWWVAGQGILMAAVLFVPPAWRWTAPAPTLWIAVGVLLVVAGGGIAALGMIELGPSLTVLPRPRPRGALVKSGPYAQVRHPIYAGLIVAAAGWAMWRMSGLHLLLAAALAAYIHAKSRREEAFLEDRFPEYAAYRARTRRLIPRIF